MKNVFFLFLFSCCAPILFGQGAGELLEQVKSRLEKVADYRASGKMKTNVTFIKTPVAQVNIFYKKPDKLKIVNTSGISFIPRGSVNINLNKFLTGSSNYELIDAGRESSTGWRILKLLPVDENAEIVLSTLYIDEKNQLIIRAKNTSRDNGTYELEMFYGKYAAYGLPDRVIFSFNTKDYKLPKGVTFDYDNGSRKEAGGPLKDKKGSVEISYTEYIINKGVDDKVFQ